MKTDVHLYVTEYLSLVVRAIGRWLQAGQAATAEGAAVGCCFDIASASGFGHEHTARTSL
jgi:hypothetical protein